MKIITLEEHFADPAVVAASAPEVKRLAPGFAATSDPPRSWSRYGVMASPKIGT
jgi:hypothetical protein